MIHKHLFSIIYMYLDSRIITHVVAKVTLKTSTTNVEAIMKSGDRYNIGYLMENPIHNINRVARLAAIYGYKAIVYAMIDKGANNYNWIAYAAAQWGHREILHEMILKGSNSWNWIAYYAARGGQKEILYDMIDNHGAKDWGEIAYGAHLGGHKDIIEYIRQLVASNR